jgi:hypothetical protein
VILAQETRRTPTRFAERRVSKDGAASRFETHRNAIEAEGKMQLICLRCDAPQREAD